MNISFNLHTVLKLADIGKELKRKDIKEVL